MKCTIVNQFKLGNVIVPKFYMKQGAPSAIIWPDLFVPDSCLRIRESVRLNLNGPVNEVLFVSCNLKIPENSMKESRLDHFLSCCTIDFEPAFVWKCLKDQKHFQPSLLGRSEKLLLNLATRAKKGGILLFTTSGCDPRGCNTVLKYAELISRFVHVIHIEFPTNMPNSFYKWQIIQGVKRWTFEHTASLTTGLLYESEGSESNNRPITEFPFLPLDQCDNTGSCYTIWTRIARIRYDHVWGKWVFNWPWNLWFSSVSGVMATDETKAAADFAERAVEVIMPWKNLGNSGKRLAVS